MYQSLRCVFLAAWLTGYAGHAQVVIDPAQAVAPPTDLALVFVLDDSPEVRPLTPDDAIAALDQALIRTSTPRFPACLRRLTFATATRTARSVSR